MRYLHITAMAAVLMSFCPPRAAVITYTTDSSVFPNPERGSLGQWAHTGYKRFVEPIRTAESYLNKCRRERTVSAVIVAYFIGEYKSSDLPQSILQRIDQDFGDARRMGFKVVPHWHYGNEGDDAPKEVIIRHVKQLAPILEKNADVVLAVYWGMIGPYGQWYRSENDNVRTGVLNPQGSVNDNTRAVYSQMMAATPSDRMMMIDYTEHKRQLTGTEPLTAAQAFGESDKARTGIGNQCFMTNVGSDGYKNQFKEGPWSYVRRDGLYTPYFGWVDVDGCGKRPTPEQFMKNAAIMNLDMVAHLVNEELGLAESDPRIREIRRRTGYRYRLKRAVLPDEAHPGAHLDASIEIINDGWGSIYNPRAIEILLRNQETGAVTALEVKGDSPGNRTRFPHPGETKTWTISQPLPRSLKAGDYELLLNLPDPCPSIHDRPEYSIRLANRTTWEASTGYNRLLHTISIKRATTVEHKDAFAVKHRNATEGRAAMKVDMLGRRFVDSIIRRKGVYLLSRSGGFQKRLCIWDLPCQKGGCNERNTYAEY